MNDQGSPRTEQRPAPGDGSRNPLVALVSFVSNLWFGIGTMAAILIYCWLGSSGIWIGPYRWYNPRFGFELTEMEWFTWWPFSLLIVLFLLSISLATVRKIPFNVPNLGVWMLHTGIVVLVVGAFVYYGLKKEGDMLVHRRAAVVTIGNGEPLEVILRPGDGGVVEGGGKVYRVGVGTLNPGYELLTGEDKGKTTYAAQLHFEPVGGQGAVSFIRQMLVGYPQYTEDVVPGQGRAIKVLGKALVDEDVKVELRYAASDELFLQHSRALYARIVGSEDWAEYPLDGLPRYRPYLSRAGDAVVPHGDPKAVVGKLALTPERDAESAAFPDDIGLEITGFMPYALTRAGWEPGGPTFNPFLRFTLKMGATPLSGELVASDPAASHVELGDDVLGVSFRWLTEQAELDALKTAGSPRLVVKIPRAGIERELSLEEAGAAPVDLGKGYSLQMMQLYPRWTLSSGQNAQMAVVGVQGPDASFQRAIVGAPYNHLSQDLGSKGHGMASKKIADPGVSIELHGVRETGLTLVAGPVGLHALLVSEDGSVEHRAGSVGQPIEFFEGRMQLVITELSETAQRVSKPYGVAKSEQDLSSGAYYSLLQVEIGAGNSAQRLWLPYSAYAHPSRMGYRPERVHLADGRHVELLYSRERMTLPRKVALETFELETYTGGEDARDYISLVRFQEDDGQWSEVDEVRSNQPTSRDGWWYFQSTWDPPDRQRGYSGLNYTGLGIGNRHGVYTMLLGCVLTVFGSLWAFYVKPFLLRRRRAELAGEAQPVVTEAPAAVPEGAALHSSGGE